MPRTATRLRRLIFWKPGSVQSSYRHLRHGWTSRALAGGAIPPGTPFGLSQYQLASRIAANQLADDATSEFNQGLDANAIGDSYILNTVLYAIVLFLAGFGTKWKSNNLQYLFLATGIVMAAFATGFLLTLPRV
jgi:hypothetical protein